MKILSIDAPTGLAGDMLLAGLLELGADWGALEPCLRRLPLDDWQLDYQKIKLEGITHGQVDFICPHQHCHRHLSQIIAMIEQADFPSRAENLAIEAFRRLARAESQVHGCSPEEVAFHEVGAMDSILDICSVALALEQLGVEQVYCSSLPLSRGWVDCAHGRLPVPAPATLKLLQGFTLHNTDFTGELITPTGAALLLALSASQQPAPAFTLLAEGRGAGHRKLPVPNGVILLLGEIQQQESAPEEDWVEMLWANLDDCSGELLGNFSEIALAEGALDVAFLPIYMKKSRPAWQVQLIAADGQGQHFGELLLRHTTALGCRIQRQKRLILPRWQQQVSTKYGDITVKMAEGNMAPEADSVAKAAREKGVSFKQVYYAAMAEIYGGEK